MAHLAVLTFKTSKSYSELNEEELIPLGNAIEVVIHEVVHTCGIFHGESYTDIQDREGMMAVNTNVFDTVVRYLRHATEQQ